MVARGAAIERWLVEDVGPAYDAIKNDPTRGIPIEKAFAAVRAHYLARVNASRRES
jgi:hypothetical protein